MNGPKWGFGCALVALLAGLYFSQAYAQGPEGVLAPAAESQPGPAGTEKSVLAENSKQAKAESNPAEFCQCVDQAESASVARIERALAAPLHSPGLDFADQGLRDVVTNLQEEYGIQIHLNNAALEEAAIGIDSPVTVQLHNISLRSALNLLLKQLQLTFIIQDEVLLITTQEDADKQLVTCVYNVQGLIDESDPQSMKSLIEAIESCVATDTWAENSDNGAASAMPLKPGLLVVSQTPAVQEKVRSLLMKIRKVREQVPIPKDRPKTPEANSKQTATEKSTGGGGGGGFGGGGGGGSGGGTR